MIETLRDIVAKRRARVVNFTTPPPVAESIDVIAEIHETEEDLPEVKEYVKERLLVDMQTANVIVIVYDAVKPETRVKMDKMMLTKRGMRRVAEIAWNSMKAA